MIYKQLKPNKKMEQLIKHSLRMIKNFNNHKSFKEQLDNYPQVLKNLDVPFAPIKKTKVIGVRNVFEDENMRISIYNIPNNVTMKLHSHPEMNVLTYILSGTMRAQIFNRFPKHPAYFTLSSVDLGKGMIALTEPTVNNLHQFTGREQGCTFLDVIFPDYDGIDRVCEFYEFKGAGEVGGERAYELTKLSRSYFDPMEDV